jgi:hypothetical protein
VAPAKCHCRGLVSACGVAPLEPLCRPGHSKCAWSQRILRRTDGCSCRPEGGNCVASIRGAPAECVASTRVAGPDGRPHAGALGVDHHAAACRLPLGTIPIGWDGNAADSFIGRDGTSRISRARSYVLSGALNTMWPLASSSISDRSARPAPIRLLA